MFLSVSTPWILLLVGSMWAALNHSQPNASCQAKIEASQQDAKLLVLAHCINAGSVPADLYYELQAERTGDAGSSRNTQSGHFQVGAGQDKVLSQLSLSIMPTDTYAITLRLLNAEGHVLATDSVYRAGH